MWNNSNICWIFTLTLEAYIIHGPFKGGIVLWCTMVPLGIKPSLKVSCLALAETVHLLCVMWKTNQVYIRTTRINLSMQVCAIRYVYTPSNRPCYTFMYYRYHTEDIGTRLVTSRKYLWEKKQKHDTLIQCAVCICNKYNMTLAVLSTQEHMSFCILSYMYINLRILQTRWQWRHYPRIYKMITKHFYITIQENVTYCQHKSPSLSDHCPAAVIAHIGE